MCCSWSNRALLQLFSSLPQRGVCLVPLLLQISLPHKNREENVLVKWTTIDKWFPCCELSLHNVLYKQLFYC